MSRRTPGRRAPVRRARRRVRAGFTLLEVLVAALVLLTGLTGIAAATAHALRMLADARLEEESALLAARRLELLRATPCTGRAAGAGQEGSLVARWTVEPHASGSATRLVVTVASRTRQTLPRRYETVAPC